MTDNRLGFLSRPAVAGPAAAGDEGLSLVRQVINATDDACALVDRGGLIVAANEALVKAAGADSEADLCGKRLGEVVHCARQISSSFGCGNMSGCAFCGINLSIIRCFAENSAVQTEASMVLNDTRTLLGANYRVQAKPMKLGSRQLAIVSLKDVSAEKIKAYIEENIVHYLVDQLGGIRGLSAFLAEALEANQHRDLASSIVDASQNALARIELYSGLLDAESGKLQVALSEARLEDLVSRFEEEAAAKAGVSVRIERRYPSTAVVSTDIGLLVGSLLSIASYAVGAQPEPSPIRLRASLARGAMRFLIHSRWPISKERRHLVYYRWHRPDSHSADGVGTYLARLRVERYLGGRVGCKSLPGLGTFYTVSLPQKNVADLRLDAA